MPPERAQLRGKCERAVPKHVVQRFLPETVAAAEQPPLGTVVDYERPHAVESAYEIAPPGAIPVEEHLGVGVVAVKVLAERNEFLAEFQMVVYLPVKDHAEHAVRRPHRLSPSLKVDDGQAAMAEVHASGLVAPQAFRVGAAVNDLVVHALEDHQVAVTREARDSAHVDWSSVRGRRAPAYARHDRASCR